MAEPIPTTSDNGPLFKPNIDHIDCSTRPFFRIYYFYLEHYFLSLLHSLLYVRHYEDRFRLRRHRHICRHRKSLPDYLKKIETTKNRVSILLESHKVSPF